MHRILMCSALLGCAAAALQASCALSSEGLGAVSSGAGAEATSSSGGTAGSGGGGEGAAGGGASVSSTAASGAQGGAGVEDCLDGVDNDGDTLVDCADDACVPDHECVPEVPATWQGYYRVAGEPYPGGAAVPCGDGTSPEEYLSGLGAAAQCSACTCGDLEGASCTLPTLAWWTNANSCGGSPANVFDPMDTACHALSSFYTCSSTCGNDQRAALAQNAMLVGAPGCPSGGGTPTLPPPWGMQQRACHGEATGAGCGAGMVCLAKSGAPYDQPACIMKEGAGACPGDWPNAIAAFDDVVDSRDCSTCTCAASGATCTGGKVTVYDDDTCGNGGSTPPLDLAGPGCASVQGHADNDEASYEVTAATLGGTCTSAGGQPIGTLDPVGPVTFCCR